MLPLLLHVLVVLITPSEAICWQLPCFTSRALMLFLRLCRTRLVLLWLQVMYRPLCFRFRQVHRVTSAMFYSAFSTSTCTWTHVVRHITPLKCYRNRLGIFQCPRYLETILFLPSFRRVAVFISLSVSRVQGEMLRPQLDQIITLTPVLLSSTVYGKG
jgi:hypothetical protein